MQSYSHDIGSLPKGKYYFPRYLSLTDLIKTLTEPANALDYDIIRPILLSIPSFTSPFEFFRCIVDRFYEANSSYVDSDQIKFKALAILHCWLEQPFAHADLAAASFEKHLKKFLRQVAGEKNDFFANITQSIRILLRRLIAEKKQLELAHQLYKLRSTASLGDGLCESMHLSSFAVDNVRVLESPLLKECAENYVGRHEESDRYSGVYFNNNASSSSGGGGSFSESCSYDDLSGEVIRSLLANDNDGKGDGATASYSTVRLSGSM